MLLSQFNISWKQTKCLQMFFVCLFSCLPPQKWYKIMIKPGFPISSLSLIKCRIACASVCLVHAHKHTPRKVKLKLRIKSQTFGAFNRTFIQSEAWQSTIPPASNPPLRALQCSRHSWLLSTPLGTCPGREEEPPPGSLHSRQELQGSTPSGRRPHPALRLLHAKWRRKHAAAGMLLPLPQRWPMPWEAYGSLPPPKCEWNFFQFSPTAPDADRESPCGQCASKPYLCNCTAK